ncbi:metallophosphoesterase [Aggregatibacter actinomycetemcomitans serotype e str. SC1083]|uniref:Metallophosphoesterase n=1 Tax=Aggregatibacter actinomycetemcomitans serotype e str. SC1083 TaxID=907488 RepID=G4A8M8_AGGAC|nr:metallophosphoesterase [Aggregatibacter actinomycetemcomitans]EGY33777.1 metallophosphoesterase [Aggregatibacter actinomycetemcomitans serotype e str. SC1083]KYK73698.1 metallophosphoesterase [Aggregatibacter actinomycetemcomitans serotype e str. SA3096]KYK80053.1 metallophosphoesterase [Aggregatibacter actinomycetemcomitans serotype e str. SC936]KYK95779.1 metallophosphoesterase [Aggregatibacter actinomycetemcomitans serotype e str. ANH9776]TYB21499.1 metallophosphoesterase [Aggregatibacte
METRYYITMLAAMLALQFMLFGLSRTLNWIFNLNGKTRCTLTIVLFLVLNALVLSAPLRLYTESFRVSALILTLLLFSTFSSLIVGFLYLLRKKWRHSLKWLYPILFLSFVTVGLYNAYTPVVRHYQVHLDKPMKPLRIGMASDTHLGKFFGGKQLDKLADIMQREKVDIILLPGDIMDDNVNAYLAEKMQPHLAKLKAPLGVYATLGNHDFFGDQARIEREIRKAGIIPLMDESLVVDNRFVLIGRNDDLVTDRPSTEQLLKGVDTNLPIILLDHRPSEIEQHATLPIDIQVSGHAHNGQIFPANLIVKFIYRLSYGYEQINGGHFFVTSGYGFWGVPMRLGSQSEVMIIDVVGG